MLPSLSHWYIPSWNGDFRLIPSPVAVEKSCVLELVDVTPSEREMLDKFLADASKRGWTSVSKVGDAAKQEILLSTTVAEAGKALVAMAKPVDTSITAVRSEGGKITVIDNSKLLAPETQAEIVSRAEADGKKAKAVSVARPTPCCPQCVPGSVDRASDVLLAFLTPEQHKTWAEHRYVVATGGKSGHRYCIAHRHSRLGVQFGRVCFDLDDGGVLHFHDNSVPPEEEVLATMLIMQHREDWLRHEATCLGVTDYGKGRVFRQQLGATSMLYEGSFRHVFKNPFGGIGDGTDATAFTSSVGAALMNLMG